MLKKPSRLQEERHQRHWSQREMADKLGATWVTVSRWERGIASPSAYFRHQLCQLFGKSEAELGLVAENEEERGSQLEKSATPPQGSPETLVAVSQLHWTISDQQNSSFTDKEHRLEQVHSTLFSAQAASSLQSAAITDIATHSSYWYVPYQRNPFFTGRDDILLRLHEALSRTHPTIPNSSCALSGLGGIGKTQTAIEYAYRYVDNYLAVFWISAETIENMPASFAAIADLLNLPEKQERDQNNLRLAITRWLTSHSDWLLILDNVENPELVKGFLPAARHGSLLFTSRQQALGPTAQTLYLGPMLPEDGRRFLLHRARLLAPTTPVDRLSPTDEALVSEIVTALDGLPLALDQAGVYIEATHCSLAEYLHLFQFSQQRLLDQRDASADHPLSVTRTFALAFELLELTNPSAAEFLTVCAFLAPEAIPEAFFLEGAPHLGSTFELLAADPFQFHAAIKALLTYSLLQRNAESHTVTIHRLLQAAIKAHLTETTRLMLARRVLHTMVSLFPEKEAHVNYWQICEELLPHALVCLASSDQRSEFVLERVTLMTYVATYFSCRARFAEAKQFYEQALQIGPRALGEEHPLLAETLNCLAFLFAQQGKFAEAEALYQRALQIFEPVLGSEHLQIAEFLEGLTVIYDQQGRYKEAEPLCQRALQITEQVLGSEHSRVATSLGNLANLYSEQSRYREAEPLYQRALQITEQVLGSEHSRVAVLLTNLADLFLQQERFVEAEPLYRQALHIWEQTLGLEHSLIAYALQGLATVFTKQGDYKTAASLYQRALVLRQQNLGPQHPHVAETLDHLAHFYQVQQQTAEALALYQQALLIREQALGEDHPKTRTTRTSYLQLLQTVGRADEAKQLVFNQSHLVGENV